MAPPGRGRWRLGVPVREIRDLHEVRYADRRGRERDVSVVDDDVAHRSGVSIPGGSRHAVLERRHTRPLRGTLVHQPSIEVVDVVVPLTARCPAKPVVAVPDRRRERRDVDDVARGENEDRPRRDDGDRFEAGGASRGRGLFGERDVVGDPVDRRGARCLARNPSRGMAGPRSARSLPVRARPR